MIPDSHDTRNCATEKDISALVVTRLPISFISKIVTMLVVFNKKNMCNHHFFMIYNYLLEFFDNIYF